MHIQYSVEHVYPGSSYVLQKMLLHLLFIFTYFHEWKKLLTYFCSSVCVASECVGWKKQPKIEKLNVIFYKELIVRTGGMHVSAKTEMCMSEIYTSTMIPDNHEFILDWNVFVILRSCRQLMSVHLCLWSQLSTLIWRHCHLSSLALIWGYLSSEHFNNVFAMEGHMVRLLAHPECQSPWAGICLVLIPSCTRSSA